MACDSVSQPSMLALFLKSVPTRPAIKGVPLRPMANSQPRSEQEALSNVMGNVVKTVWVRAVSGDRIRVSAKGQIISGQPLEPMVKWTVINGLPFCLHTGAAKAKAGEGDTPDSAVVSGGRALSSCGVGGATGGDRMSTGLTYLEEQEHFAQPRLTTARSCLDREFLGTLLEEERCSLTAQERRPGQDSGLRSGIREYDDDSANSPMWR